jgi:hypothetical protein
MAQRNFWVDGLSGTGKSSVYEELVRRRYFAVSTDRAWKDAETRTWVEERAFGELESGEPDVLFVCGGGAAQWRPHFTKVFYLRIDEATMRERLGRRTEADWSMGEEGVALTLTLQGDDVTPPGAVEIDATQPLPDVVDEILRLAGCPPQGSHERPRDVVETAAQYLDARTIERSFRLDPSAFDPAELERYYEEAHGVRARRVGYAMVDAIAYFRDSAERDA